MTIIFHIAALWWCVLIAILVGSAILALAQPFLARRRAKNAQMPPVSVLVPLKDNVPGLSAAASSVFAQRYPAFDVTFSSVDESSPAIRTVLRVTKDRPALVRRTLPAAGIANPKVANLVDPIATATHDHLLLKDAATRLPVGGLRAMMRSLGPGVGLVCAVPIARGAKGFLARTEQAIINTLGARFLLAASALGLNVGIGAAMLVRRSDLARSDGLDAMARSVADDHALAKALQAVGLRTALADVTVDQALERRSLPTIRERHRRWALCRRREAPPVFFLEPFIGALAACIVGALSAPAFGTSPLAMILLTLVVWVAVETGLALLKRWPASPWTPLAILAREALMPTFWWAALKVRGNGWIEEPTEPRIRLASGQHPTP